jgi:hypothetical protein
VSEKIEDGGPAFPTTIHGVTEFSGQPTIDTYEGMSLRDWFAQKAPLAEIEEIKFKNLSRVSAEVLAGRSHPVEPRKPTREELVSYQIDVVKWQAEVTAALRFIMADAMLKARLP